MRRAILALLIATTGCGGGTDGTPVAPPAAPAPTPPPAPEPPGVPSSLRVSASGEDFVEWTWNAVEGADGYDVQFSLDEMFDSADEIIGRTADQTSYRRQPLPADTRASLRVRSASGSGGGRITSDWSAPVTGMTPPPPIEITPVDRGVSVTDRGQILVELTPGDIVPANPLDLAGRTLVFTPDGRGGYSRSVRALAWEEDLGDRVDDKTAIEPSFRFDFAGQMWESFFVSRYGLVTFGEPYPFPQNGPDRWGTMQEIAVNLGAPPLIAALYKPQLGGRSTRNAEALGNVQHVSRRADRVLITWITTDANFHVYGVPPQEKTRFQLALHADGRIALNYAPETNDPDEAIRDGIVGLFPSAKTGLLGSIPDPVDGALPGYLDLVETGIYTIADPALVLVEFTTRGPIPAIPDQTPFYEIEIHTDEPYGRTIQAGAWVLPDGRRLSTGAARTAYSGHADDHRIGALIDLRTNTLSGLQASVVARTWARSDTTGERRSGNEWSPPAIIRFPDVAASAITDLSRPGSSAVQLEVFHHTRAKEQVRPKQNLFPVVCRVIEVLGDEFDGFVFHSQFRYDLQFSGSTWGHFPGNVPTRGVGFTEGELRRKSPCGRRMRGQWRYSVWTKSDYVAVRSGGYAVSPRGPWLLAHEFTHTWTANAYYLRNGEPKPLSDGAHWLPGLHSPGAFVSSGGLMGGVPWRENPDGTFTPRQAGVRTVGHSWLDLYLAGLATPDEVPDTFILRNLRETGSGSQGPHTAEKEIVTMEQILAALGPRDPPAARSQKVFNIGFVYLLEPGQAPDQDQLGFHALFLDGALEHWARITGGRSQLTTELPGR